MNGEIYRDMFSSFFGIFLIFLEFAIAVLAIRIALFCIGFFTSCYSAISGVSVFRAYFNKGLRGEYKTVRMLEHTSSHERILTNVYLSKARSEQTTEIDVVYINENGIFSVECKNYGGWIFGREQDSQWTQVLNKNTKNRFYNPVRQNAAHIAALTKLLPDFREYFYSIIAFNERCELKNISVTPGVADVIYRTQIRRAVKKYEGVNDPLSDSQINDIWRQLLPFTNVDDKLKQEHIDNIKSHLSGEFTANATLNQAVNSKHLKSETAIAAGEAAIKPPTDSVTNATITARAAETNSSAVNSLNKPEDERGSEANEKIACPNETPSCPKCGAAMVRRRAVKGANAGGEFWGCSNYPKCRGISSIEKQHFTDAASSV